MRTKKKRGQRRKQTHSLHAISSVSLLLRHEFSASLLFLRVLSFFFLISLSPHPRYLSSSLSMSLSSSFPLAHLLLLSFFLFFLRSWFFLHSLMCIFFSFSYVSSPGRDSSILIVHQSFAVNPWTEGSDFCLISSVIHTAR